MTKDQFTSQRRKRLQRAVARTLRSEVTIGLDELDEIWMRAWFGRERRVHPLWLYGAKGHKRDILRWACRPCSNRLCVWFRFERDLTKFLLFRGGKMTRDCPDMVNDLKSWLRRFPW